MEIKIVKYPYQGDKSKPEDLEYITYNDEGQKIIPTWSVSTYMHREGDGGMQLWFNKLKNLESRGVKIVYLYSIIATNGKICNGYDNEGNDKYIDDIFYTIRYDFKK